MPRFCALAVQMIPGSGVPLFLGGFSVSIVGQEFRVGLWVTKLFWKLGGVSFNGAPLLWGGIRLFLYDGFRWFWFRGDDGRGGSDGNGSNGSLVGLGDQ